MTIKELIEILSEYPEDMDVVVMDDAGYGCSVEYVRESYGTLQIRHN